MRRAVIKFISLLLAAGIALPLLAPVHARASIPTRRTLRIGLTYGSTALPSANLANASVSTAGYEFGYYDSNLTFTKIAETSEPQISIMVDRNLRWNSGGEFSGTFDLVGSDGLGTGSYSVGFAHVRLSTSFRNYTDAKNAVSGYSDGFVKYVAGAANPYVPMFGNFNSSQTANSVKGSGTVDTGTATTITVAKLGSNKILFEFENDANRNLIFGVRPNGGSTSTSHYRGYQYQGGFRYERRSATVLTVVNIIPLEDYVKGVVPYEMSASWPLEALKAQAICARTFALSQISPGKHNSSYGFDLCNTADCQVYRGRNSANSNSDSAVTSTAGQVVTYNGSLIQTLYSSSHGGGSENNENVWAGTALPYLRGVLDEYDDRIGPLISNYEWTLSISQADLTQRVRNAGYPSASTISTLQVSQYSPTGNVISVTARDTNGNSYTFSRRAGLQALFGATPLRSQRFNIGSVVWTLEKALYANSPSVSFSSSGGAYYVTSGSSVTAVTPSASNPLMAIDGSGNIIAVDGGGTSLITSGAATGPSNGYFVLKGKGWGHSVGMSQWGARSQAQYYGRTAEQIIKHYYTGVSITQA